MLSVQRVTAVAAFLCMALAVPSWAQRAGGDRGPASERGGSDKADRGGDREKGDRGAREHPDKSDNGGTGQPAAAAPSFDTIVLNNRCSTKIFVAIYYAETSASWTAKGWYTVAPNSSLTPDVESRGAIVYFFGYSPGGSEWNGEGEVLSRRIPTVDQAFSGSVGGLTGRSGSTLRSFFGRSTGKEYGTVSQSFTCQ